MDQNVIGMTQREAFRKEIYTIVQNLEQDGKTVALKQNIQYDLSASIDYLLIQSVDQKGVIEFKFRYSDYSEVNTNKIKEILLKNLELVEKEQIELYNVIPEITSETRKEIGIAHLY